MGHGLYRNLMGHVLKRNERIEAVLKDKIPESKGFLPGSFILDFGLNSSSHNQNLDMGPSNLNFKHQDFYRSKWFEL